MKKRLNKLPKSQKKTVLPFRTISLVLLLVMAGCGSGGGDHPSTTTKADVTITGKVEISSQYTPLQEAECRLVDSQGEERAVTTSDETGQYTLDVPAGVEGYLHCTPPGFSNLDLSTYYSTKGLSGGDTLENEDVTILSTVAAQVIASEAPADPVGRKAELLNDLTGRLDPDLNLVAELSEKLYTAMLHNSLDIDFSGETSRQTDGHGIRGHVSSGVDAAPIAGARCEFMVEGPLSMGRSILYTAALADFYADGALSRPDLQVVQQQINGDYNGYQQEIVDVLARVFPNGIGQACATTTDENGAYFLAVPPDIPGYVRCTPPDQDKMVLMAYVPGRAEGESLSSQDVSPATTVHSVQIASRLNNTDVEIPRTKNNFSQDIAGLQVRMVQADGVVTGFELVPDTAPANQEIGLAAFAATALFNILYQNRLNIDFAVVLENFFRRRGLDSEMLTAQGVEADVALACTEVVDTSVTQAESVLGTQLSHAMSTARFNITVLASPGGPPVPDARIYGYAGSDQDLYCAGCDTSTNAQGQVTLFFSGVSDDVLKIKLYAHHEDYDGYSITEVVPIVPMAVQDITLIMSYSHLLRVHGAGDDGRPQFEYDGSGSVTSHDSQIDCSIINGIGDPIVVHILSDTFFLKSYCKANFASNAAITLTAVPSESSTFIGWDAEGTECSGTDPRCTVTMDSAKQVVPLFLPRCDPIRAEKLFRVWPIYRSLSADGTGDDAYLSVYDDYPDSCGALTASTTADWITVDQTESSDNRLILSENPDVGPRTGTVIFDGIPVTITQDGQQCAITDYAVSPVTTAFEAAGGTGTIDVHASDNCPWQAVTDKDWIAITSGEPDAGGEGTVTYSVLENQGTTSRGGTITIAGTHHMVVQNEASANPAPSLSIQGEGNGAGSITTYQISGRDYDGADKWEEDYKCNINGANANGKCNQIYAPDTKVKLRVETTWEEADSNFLFSNWTGSCDGFYEECVLNMDQMHTVGAHFITSHQADLVVEELESYETNRPVRNDYLSIGTPIQVTTSGGYAPVAGYHDRVYLRIVNRGVQDAQTFSVGLYISSDAVITTDDILLAHGRVEIESLAAKETLRSIEPDNTEPDNIGPYNGRDHEVWIPTDLPPGPAYLGVIVDESNQVSEDIETNNRYAIPVYLVNAEEDVSTQDNLAQTIGVFNDKSASKTGWGPSTEE